MKKVWSDEAWEEYLYWQTQDRKIIKKINNLIKKLMWLYNSSIGRKVVMSVSGIALNLVPVRSTLA